MMVMMIRVLMMMMMMMIRMMMMMMMTIGCLPGDADVAWFGDDHSVLPLGKRVQQQREALQSLKRAVGERLLFL